MGAAFVGNDSLRVHVYLNNPMTKVFVKELKPLINVTCLFFQQFGVPKVHACMIILSVDARASVPFKLICSCTYTCICKEDT